MYIHTSLLLTLLTLGIQTAKACLVYRATFPFDTNDLFEAEIVDNGVKTCWLKLSYREHEKMQELHTQSRGGAGSLIKQEIYVNDEAVLLRDGKAGKGVGKRSVGRRIRLTELKSLREQGREKEKMDSKDSASSTFSQVGSEGKGTAKGTDSGVTSTGIGRTIASEKNLDGEWLPWTFECLNGYKGHVNIGLRSVSYTAHGQDFWFVPGVKEDIFEEVWRYETRLWCKGADADGRDEKGNPLKGEKGVGKGGNGESERKGVQQGDVKKEIKEVEKGSN